MAPAEEVFGGIALHFQLEYAPLWWIMGRQGRVRISWSNSWGGVRVFSQARRNPMVVEFPSKYALLLDCIYGPVFRPHAHQPHAFLEGICEVWLSTSICLVSFCLRLQKRCVRSEKTTLTEQKNRFFRAVSVEYILRWNSTLKPCRQNISPKTRVE